MTRPLFAPIKSLGQHFLHDPRVLAAIADLALPAPGSGVVEIGAGTGNLTACLLDRLPRGADGRAPLALIEVDRRAPETLRARFGDVFDLEMGDAARLDWHNLLWSGRLGPQPVVVGNLPYHAALPILFALLDLARPPARVVAMVQKEVAQRLCAPAGSAARGQASVGVQLRARATVALSVGRGAFQPPPKVESSVVVLEPAAWARADLEWSDVRAVIQAGFGRRRKTLANALAALGRPTASIQRAIAGAGIAAQARAEQVTNLQWVALAAELKGSETTSDGACAQGTVGPDPPLRAHSGAAWRDSLAP